MMMVKRTYRWVQILPVVGLRPVIVAGAGKMPESDEILAS